MQYVLPPKLPSKGQTVTATETITNFTVKKSSVQMQKQTNIDNDYSYSDTKWNTINPFVFFSNNILMNR